MAKELIYRDDVLAELMDVMPGDYESQTNMKVDIRMRVKRVSAVDAVEVVRCRECVHGFTDTLVVNGSLVHVHWYCKAWDGNDFVPTEENGFCSRGKRREEGLYESLKRGLQEAIAYENGEIECRTETREDGDGDA